MAPPPDPGQVEGPACLFLHKAPVFPGAKGGPRVVAFMLLPGEQMPGHAARQLNQRRRP
jgi:hypothetical protein